MRKKYKIFFSKMALTILIKLCGFIVHSKTNNMTLSAFLGKIPETRKIVFKFSVRLEIICIPPFHFRPTLNIKDTLILRVADIRDKKRSEKHEILQI